MTSRVFQSPKSCNQANLDFLQNRDFVELFFGQKIPDDAGRFLAPAFDPDDPCRRHDDVHRQVVAREQLVWTSKEDHVSMKRSPSGPSPSLSQVLASKKFFFLSYFQNRALTSKFAL